MALAAPTTAAAGAAPAPGGATLPTSPMVQLMAQVLPKALPVLRDNYNSYVQARAAREEAEAMERARLRAEAAKPRPPTLRMRPAQREEPTHAPPTKMMGPPSRRRLTLAAGGPVSFGWSRRGVHDRIDP